ncbi:MAG: MFS transporter, partial [Henriciella sp.]
GTFLFAAQWGYGIVDQAPLVLMAHFIAGFAAIPVWVWFSKRTEKHVALRSVCLWSAITYISFLPLSLMNTGMTGLLIATLVSGLGYGAPFVLLRSMMADLVEAEAAKDGQNRAGLFYSLMSGAYKTGASFAIGIPYILLGALVGFDPAGDNSEATILGLMLVFVFVPVTAYALAAMLIWKYPITREIQAANAGVLSSGRVIDAGGETGL